MKIHNVIFSIIFTGLCVSGCTRYIYEIKQKKYSGGTVEINIQTIPDYPNICVTIDGVRIDIEELKSYIEKKKKDKAIQERDRSYIYGTF